MTTRLWDEQRKPVMIVLRAAMGIIFITIGWNKLTNLDGTTGMFDAWGVPFASFVAAATGVAEVLGGLAVLLGVFPRVGAGLLSLVMLGSMAYVKVPGPVGPANGWAVDVILFASAVTIILNGAGRWTLFELLGRQDLDPEERLLQRTS